MRETYAAISKQLRMEKEAISEIDTGEMQLAKHVERLEGVGSLDLPILRGSSYNSSESFHSNAV